MDQSPASRSKLMPLNVLLLLTPACIVCLHGDATEASLDLNCVNDYLFTINCTLTPFAPSPDDHGSTYWLNITNSYEHKTYVCPLTKTHRDYFCSVQTSDPARINRYSPPIFSDTDSFEISRCRSHSVGPGPCRLLDADYRPLTNIKPNAPRNLTVEHNSSRFRFAWQSTYEEYGDFTEFASNLQYQLHYHKRGDGEDTVTSHSVSANKPHYSMDDAALTPNAEYTARVRSSPNQAFYKGHWSGWSSEVRWQTADDLPANTLVPELATMLFISMCVVAPFALLLCYVPVKKWSQRDFIPSPAPYFHTLYSDCQGDFKNWVVTPEQTRADTPAAAASLQIGALTKWEPQFLPPSTEGSGYGNVKGPVWDPPAPGVPRAAGPGAGSSQTSLSSEPGVPGNGDSGCWVCGDTPVERASPGYCNEYCTLSAFQQTGPTADERNDTATSGQQRIRRVDAVEEPRGGDVEG